MIIMRDNIIHTNNILDILLSKDMILYIIIVKIIIIGIFHYLISFLAKNP